MIEWRKRFIKYAAPGDLLLLDNLSANLTYFETYWHTF